MGLTQSGIKSLLPETWTQNLGFKYHNSENENENNIAKIITIS